MSTYRPERNRYGSSEWNRAADENRGYDSERDRFSVAGDYSEHDRGYRDFDFSERENTERTFGERHFSGHPGQDFSYSASHGDEDYGTHTYSGRGDLEESYGRGPQYDREDGDSSINGYNRRYPLSNSPYGDASTYKNSELGSYGYFGARSYAGKGPKGYKRSDERIKEDVSEGLARHPEVDASDIEVAVHDAEVTLSGTVRERLMKRIAEDIAERSPGVKEVHNMIRMNLEPENLKRGD